LIRSLRDVGKFFSLPSFFAQGKGVGVARKHRSKKTAKKRMRREKKAREKRRERYR